MTTQFELVDSTRYLEDQECYLMPYLARMGVVQLTTTLMECWLAAGGTISLSFGMSWFNFSE